MAQKQTWASRFTRVGTSRAIIIPKDVRELLRLIPGDLIVMRVFGPYVVMRRVDPSMVIDVNEIPADALPSAVRA